MTRRSLVERAWMGCIRRRDTWRTFWVTVKWWPRSGTEDVGRGTENKFRDLRVCKRAEHGEVHEMSALLLQPVFSARTTFPTPPTHAIEANGEEPPSFALSGVWLNNDSTDAMRATHAPTLLTGSVGRS
jgi:hypothetical protein